jgi:hypothetical protein
LEIDLKPDAEAYLKAQVASGRFSSVEEAIDALARDDEIAHAEIDAADLSWAEPYQGHRGCRGGEHHSRRRGTC